MIIKEDCLWKRGYLCREDCVYTNGMYVKDLRALNRDLVSCFIIHFLFIVKNYLT